MPFQSSASRFQAKGPPRNVTVPVAAEGATVAVSVMLAPVVAVVEEAASAVVVAVNVELQATPLTAKFVGIALVTPFQVPLNPNTVLDSAGSDAARFTGLLFTVTLAPLWVSVPFQELRDRLSVGKGQVSAQLLSVVFPCSVWRWSRRRRLSTGGEMV